MSNKWNDATAGVRMRLQEYELLKLVATAEDRTMLSVFSAAVRLYATKKQPQIAASFYRDEVPVSVDSLSKREQANLHRRAA